MKYLTERGMGLADMMRGESEVIEVNAKMTAKMLGYHNADLAAQQKEMIRMGVRGDTEKRMLKCDELDAISAAITAYLHVIGKTVSIAGDDGAVIIPRI